MIGVALKSMNDGFCRERILAKLQDLANMRVALWRV